MEPAERDGRRLHWAREGSGPAVLLIPGLGSGQRLFGTLPRRFARLERSCVTFDPAGIPPSSPHDGEWDFDAACDDVLAVLDAAGVDRCDVVGTSLGGKVGLVLAARAPERVRSLTMLASAAAPSPRSRWVHRFFRVIAEQLGPDEFATAVAPFLFGRTFHAQRPAVLEDLVRAMRPADEVRALMVAQADALLRFDGSGLAARLRCPVLALAGAEDTLTPAEEVQASAAVIPQCTVEVIPNAGHSLLLESAAAFERVAAFLRQRTRSDADHGDRSGRERDRA
jgi:3-oxoadipate enol-lactonase/4-carboxymuconolactone decarboxylase